MKMFRKDEGKCLKHCTGEKGESLARKYFSDRGYDILETNWRYGHWEIDIIASRQNVLHIIEVKTRTSHTGGYPEENVNHRKLLTLMKAAEVYCGIYKGWTQLQFDILAITLNAEGAEFFLLEDVYV